MDKEQILSIKSGMRVRVWSKVKEGNKIRTVPFEGTVLARKHGKGTSATFTVRKIGAGEVGIERVWPFHSPLIEKVDILASPKVRRAKLYYLRDLSRRKTKAKLRKTSSKPSIENVSPKETNDSVAG